MSEARALIGAGRLIGATANTADDVRAAVRAGADYIGWGPFRFTTTKARLSPILGLEGYERVVGECRRDGFVPPIVAIGGITPDDIDPLMATGIAGIALSGAILSAPDPASLTASIINILNKHHTSWTI